MCSTCFSKLLLTLWLQRLATQRSYWTCVYETSDSNICSFSGSNSAELAELYMYMYTKWHWPSSIHEWLFTPTKTKPAYMYIALARLQGSVWIANNKNFWPPTKEMYKLNQNTRQTIITNCNTTNKWTWIELILNQLT